MSMNNDERLFMMMATIEQLVEQTKQQQAVITAQTEQITQLANTVEKQLETIKGLKDENLKSAKELETAVLRGVTNTVHQSLGLPLEQQVRRGVDRRRGQHRIRTIMYAKEFWQLLHFEVFHQKKYASFLDVIEGYIELPKPFLLHLFQYQKQLLQKHRA